MSRAGYWTWYPFDRRRRKRRRGNVDVVEYVNEPYFGGYVFLALRFAEEDFAGLLEIDEVITVVRSPMSREPLRIPDGVMERLMERALVRFSSDDGARFVSGLMREIMADGEAGAILYLDAAGRRKLDTSKPISAARKRRDRGKPTTPLDDDEKVRKIRVGLA